MSRRKQNTVYKNNNKTKQFCVCVVYMRWDWLHPKSTTQTNFLDMSAAHEIVQHITTYFNQVLRSALRAHK